VSISVLLTASGLLASGELASERLALVPHHTKRKERTMPILLWLLGIPIPLIILIMLLHH
jgi:hypothetical protein